MKKLHLIVLIVLGIILAAIGAVFFVLRGKDNGADGQKVAVLVRSDVPGFSFKIQDSDRLQEFLDTIGFLQNKNWKVDTQGTFYWSNFKALEVVYSDKVQPELQLVIPENKKEDGTYPVLSSIGKTFSSTTLTLTIQADVALLGSMSDANATIQNLFATTLLEMLPQGEQLDIQSILTQYQEGELFFELSQKKLIF